MKAGMIMNVRNLLRPGDFVMLLPVGIKITLQYDASGCIEKVYTGYDSERADKTDDILKILVNNDKIPSRIQITKGTSWIKGILYTGAIAKASGSLPKAVESELLKKFLDAPDTFNFFAASVESTSVVFRGATSARQCLAMAKFRLLPGWIIPAKVSEKTVETWINSNIYPFGPIITDFIIYHNDDVSIIPTGLTQVIVEKIETFLDFNGYVKSKLIVGDSDRPIYIDYSDTVNFTIRKDSVLVFDSNHRIIYCKNEDSAKPYNTVVSCKRCGKKYNIPKSGYVYCPDEHCPSRIMPEIIQFINVLNLPEYDKENLQNDIEKNTITCIPDIFLLPEYEKINIEVTFTELLRSVVPIKKIPRDDVFTAFAFACSQNERTFRYYIQNPDMISSDLGMEHHDLDKFVEWLSDGYNLSDLTTLLDLPNIKIKTIEKKFNGAPIFRNKTICITGTFVRGSLAEIATILQSYSANVVFRFSNIVDCVLTGSTNENIDGSIIRDAKTMKKVIMTEDDFFKRYGIDDDIHAGIS